MGMAIFRFFQNGNRPPSWIYGVLGPNRCNSFDNMQVVIFCEFGSTKRHISAPLRSITTKSGTMMHIDPVNLSTAKFQFLKFQDDERPPF